MAKQHICCWRVSGPLADIAKSTRLTRSGLLPHRLLGGSAYNLLHRTLWKRQFQMAEERAQRRLAAILAADVVGYSRLMGADEAGTAKLVRERREAATPIVAAAASSRRPAMA